MKAVESTGADEAGEKKTGEEGATEEGAAGESSAAPAEEEDVALILAAAMFSFGVLVSWTQ